MGYNNYNNNDDDKAIVNITGLWKSKDGTGLNGTLGGARIVIYKNKFKEEERQPDYLLAVAKKNKKKDAPPRQERQDDIPF